MEPKCFHLHKKVIAEEDYVIRMKCLHCGGEVLQAKELKKEHWLNHLLWFLRGKAE
mgnify:CR=1 FL=1